MLVAAATLVARNSWAQGRSVLQEVSRPASATNAPSLTAADLDSFRAYRELSPRLPVLIDEGCRDLRSIAPIAQYADGIVIKLSKCGGIREALRMIHAARALGLKVMLGCMIESELGIGYRLRSA